MQSMKSNIHTLWGESGENFQGYSVSLFIKPLVIATSAIFVVSFLVKAFRWRSQYKGLHGSLSRLPFNAVFGNIPAFAAVAAHYPSNCHGQQILTLLHRKYNLGPLHFLDTWPVVGHRQMSINDPGLAAQVQALSLPKHPVLKQVIQHICGPTSILYAEGTEWKHLRSLFNPGFAMSHLMTLVPGIVDDTLIFKQLLETACNSGKPIQMEKLTSSLAVDIIGHVMLDHDFNAQTTDNKFVRAYDRTVSWSPSGSLVKLFNDLNPLMPIMHWYNTKIMNRYINKVISERQRQVRDASRPKPVFDLAYEKYQDEDKCEDRRLPNQSDAVFNSFAVDQLKTFIFAGRDTTSTTISYIYYILSLHPESQLEVRREHDAVFGSEPAAAAQLLKDDPILVNKLVYTTAVIKEVLRLFPPASAVRTGEPNASLTLNGATYPTASHMVWINTHTIHRLASLFPDPDAFIPERFLPPFSVPKDAWRPFEKGPRSCIGQEFSMLEMKIVMALTLREFEFENAFVEWDRKLGRKPAGEMFGYRAYQVMEATAKPVDQMPMWVRQRGVSEDGAVVDHI